MFKLCVGSAEWLYDGPKALKRAKFAAALLMRRLNVGKATIVPYCMNGDIIVIGKVRQARHVR